MKFISKAGRRTLIGHMVVHSLFWMVLNIGVSVGALLFFDTINTLTGSSYSVRFPMLLAGALLTSLLQGTILGCADYFINNRFFVVRSVWKSVLLYLVACFLMLVLTHLVLGYLFTSGFLAGAVPLLDKREKWDAVLGLSIFISFAGVVISAIGVQVIKKYGKDIFLPMIFGFYRRPKEEDRIFMFMDIKSSTILAEQIGHLQYSAFIQDFILDVNACLMDFNANIYQYVGDEVVLTWKSSNKNATLCLGFFYACKRQVESRKDHYLKAYGQYPIFKAGVDTGIVTAVEIGDTKRDIAYHGDILNTAARIQALCNATDNELLVSQVFMETLNDHDRFRIKPIGEFALRGKEKTVPLFSVATPTL